MNNQKLENVEVKNVKGVNSQLTDQILYAKDVTIEDLKLMDKFPCVIEKQKSKTSKEVYKIKFTIGDGMNAIVKEMYINENVYNLLFRKHKCLNPEYTINNLICRGRVFRGCYSDGNIWVRIQIFIWEGKQFNFFLKGDELELFKDLVITNEFAYVDKRIKIGNNQFKKEYKKFTIFESKEELTEEEVDSYFESWESK